MVQRTRYSHASTDGPAHPWGARTLLWMSLSEATRSLQQAIENWLEGERAQNSPLQQTSSSPLTWAGAPVTYS